MTIDWHRSCFVQGYGDDAAEAGDRVMRVRETHTYHSLVLSLGIIVALCTVPASAASTPTPATMSELGPRFPCSAYHEAVERKQARRQRQQRRRCEATPSPACQDALKTRSEHLERLIRAIRNWREPNSAKVILSVLRVLNPVASTHEEQPSAPEQRSERTSTSDKS